MQHLIKKDTHSDNITVETKLLLYLVTMTSSKNAVLACKTFFGKLVKFTQYQLPLLESFATTAFITFV